MVISVISISKKKQEDILPAEEVYKTEDITQLTASSHL